MRIGKLFLFLTSALILPAQLLWGLEAGVARIDITPVTGLAMSGFAARKSPSAGVLDPLYARVLVLRSGSRSFGLVVYDLIGTLDKNTSCWLKKEISSRTGLGEVIFIATHTHSGPQIKDEEKIEDLPDWERAICNKTIDAFQEAYRALKPVRIGTGWGAADLTYNRIKVQADRRVEMIWENHQKTPLGPVDQTVGVIRIDDLEGNPVAILVNYACHPVILGSDNLLYSADFPGVLCRELQKNVKGNPLCIFINGACGDMNPYYADENEKPKERIEEVGRELAQEAARITEKITTRPYAEDSTILWQIKYYNAAGRWDTEKWKALEPNEKTWKMIENMGEKEKDLNLPLSLVLITPEIGLVGLPGEFFCGFQEEIRARSPVDFLFIAGYTNGGFGYFPTIDAAVKGGYGANDEATYTRPGTGEYLAVEAAVGLYELLGKLRPIPAKPEKGYQY